MNAFRPPLLRAAVLLLAAGAAPLPAQVLHTNDRWDECAIVLDHALTQDAWHRFVAELGVVGYYRPQAGARPLGRGRVELSVVQTNTRIDPAAPAWNDTFSHPDSTHWLIEGDALPIPSLAFRVGVSDRVDVGGYVTKNFASNYGLVGAQLQYSLRSRADSGISASGRLSAARLFGPEDMTFGVYGLDLAVSRPVSRFEPYAVISGHVAHGHETTSQVNLADETVLGVQGTLGLAVRIWGVRLGAEYTLARVNAYAFKIGYGF
jgi:hypothetical protein